MKKTSTKFIIAIVLLTIISLSSFAMLSFSLADENNGATDTTAVFAASNSYTHIDRIIENSKNGGFGDVDDKIYHIVEITSYKKSSLETLCQNVFKDYVIDGHRSIEDVMAADSVDYKSFIAGQDDEDAQIAAIQKADLIYVHNDPSENGSYIFNDKKNTDIKESVKLALSTAATSDHKPFIIDSYKGTISNIKANTTYSSLVANEFNTSLATYVWPNSDAASVPEFFGMKISDAFYTRIKGNNAKANWDGGTNAKVLVIGSGTLYGNFNGAKDDVKSYGYVQSQYKPDDFKYDNVSPSDDLSGYDLATYDYILLDTGCANQPISTANYNALAAAAYAKVRILYSSTLKTAASNDSNNSDNPGSAYAFLLEKVATSNDTSKFGNVLVTNFSKMNIYANANRAKTVDDIANIIINGSFRGIKGNNSGDDTTNVYTVLEIEPSYPIDTDLAKVFYENKTYDELDNDFVMSFINEKFAGKGSGVLFDRFHQKIFYYLRTNNVLNGETADEISFDGVTPISNYSYDQLKSVVANMQKDNNSALSDYYRWHISQAKIAHATGLPYNQVKVVHMSSIEFNTNRAALTDAYDAIYIGGDISGMKAQNKWDNGGQYLMYFRDGDNGDPTVASSNGTYRSNDISKQKLDELIKYSNSLPVIVDSEVATAFDGGTSGVDPNSNMGKAIASFKANSSASNILYGFDSNNTVKIVNNDSQYGTTYGGIVTVFAGKKMLSENNDMLFDVTKGTYDYDDNQDYGNESKNETALNGVLTSAQRPKLSVTAPKTYVETDSTTWITKDDFDFKYNVNGASSSENITVQLFIDDNGNGSFDEDEVRYTTTGSSGEFNPKSDEKWIGEDFFGPVYWKLVVTDSGYGTSTSTTSISKVKRTNQGKMKVKLLQIMPETSESRGNDSSKATLYLCTECQLSKRIMHGNLSVNNNQGKYGQGVTDGLGNGFSDTFTRELNGTAKSILKLTKSSGGGGSTYPDEAGFVYKHEARAWYWNDKTKVAKGRSVVISGCSPGDVFQVQAPAYLSENSNFTLKVSSGTNVITINGGDSSFSDIIVADDGIVKVEYPDPEAGSSSTAEKEYNFIVDFLTNDDENYSYSSYGNDLGIHDHKFGIIKYDAHEKRYNNKNDDTLIVEGYEDFNSNWFLDFQNDYEVETTILDIPQYTEYVDNVEATYSDVAGDRAAVKAKRDTYYKASEKYYRLYSSVRKLINGTSLNDIDDPTTDVNEQTELIDYLMAKSGDGLSMGAEFSGGSLTYKYNPSEDEVKSMLNAYSHASENIDSFLETNRDSIWTDNKGYMNVRRSEYDREIDFYLNNDIEPTQRSYYMFFSLFENQNDKVSPDYAKLYVVWRDAKILEQYLFHEYKENEIYSSVYYEDDYADSLIGKFNLKNAFTCVAVGAADNFNGQDITDEDACYAIKNFADDNGSVLLFHDTLCPTESPLNSGTPTMTRILGETFGQGGVSDSTTHRDGYSVTQKTMQIARTEGHEDENILCSQQNNNFFNWHCEEDNSVSLVSANDIRLNYTSLRDTGSNKANKVNSGIITYYPFTIDDTLTISPTNAAGFTANIDEKEMVVYYTISGGTAGTSSSPFVANKNDGANNYFLYQYHNVTYTGAGHSAVTGKGRDNNDERRLFINVILNSARKSTAGPDLTLHDYSSTDDKQTNGIIKISNQKEANGLVEDKAEYYTYVDSTDETPIFSFRPVAPAGVKSIKIWYDVSCNGNDYKGVYNGDKADSDGNKDVLIYDTSNIDNFKRKTYYSEPDRWIVDDVSSTLSAEHIESGKVKRISDETGINYKSSNLYGIKRLEGYECTEITEPIKDDSGKIIGSRWTFEKDADNNNILDKRNMNIPRVTHYSNLKLDESYFTGNGGKCTYICVQLIDNKNKPITRTIRVELKPELLDLN